jgi:hypothetical protein
MNYHSRARAAAAGLTPRRPQCRSHRIAFCSPWFCTDTFFEGTCRTFGPSEYAQLPWDVNRKISSGRRIHEHYPYGAPPAWR